MLSHRTYQNLDIAVSSVSAKYVRYWSQVFTATTDGAQARNFASSSKNAVEKKEK